MIRSIPTYDWLEDGVDCLKAEREFVEPLERLCENENLREDIGNAAAERSEAFQLDAVGDQLIALYERLVEA